MLTYASLVVAVIAVITGLLVPRVYVNSMLGSIEPVDRSLSMKTNLSSFS